MKLPFKTVNINNLSFDYNFNNNFTYHFKKKEIIAYKKNFFVANDFVYNYPHLSSIWQPPKYI
jgi:hypothetical protein